MQGFWDAYAAYRTHATRPAYGPVVGQRRLPPALVITAEADVLRDEGEAYAERLRRNGTRVSAVPYPGIPSDFLSRSNLYASHASHAAHRGIHRVIIYLAAGRASPRQPPPS